MPSPACGPLPGFRHAALLCSRQPHLPMQIWQEISHPVHKKLSSTLVQQRLQSLLLSVSSSTSASASVCACRLWPEGSPCHSHTSATWFMIRQTLADTLACHASLARRGHRCAWQPATCAWWEWIHHRTWHRETMRRQHLWWSGQTMPCRRPG